MNLLFIGDIVGRAGRRAVRKLLPELREKNQIDIIIANGENAAGGFGITKKVANELFNYGIDCLTMGNHTWNNKDIFSFIDEEPRLIRPLNYIPDPDIPGKGWTTITKEINKRTYKIGVINLIGQVFMGNHLPPITVFDQKISEIKESTDFIVIDFHAEATGEKLAFANYVDGQVACVVGTHTHVQTADAKILESGTGYITDLGLTGAVDSILGMKKDKVIQKYKTQLPAPFEVGTGQCQLTGLLITVDPDQGKTTNFITIRNSD